MLKTKATKGGGGEKPEIDAGSHHSVCVAVVDLGTQENYGAKNEPTQKKHQIYLGFEIPDVAGPGGGSLVLGRALNFTLHEKATLRKFVEALAGKKLEDGQEVEFRKLLGCNCLLDISINDNGYPRIEGAIALTKGSEKKKASRTAYYFDLDEGKEPEIPSWLPKHYGSTLREVIEAAPEYGGQGDSDGAVGSAQVPVDDESPF